LAKENPDESNVYGEAMGSHGIHLDFGMWLINESDWVEETMLEEKSIVLHCPCMRRDVQDGL